MPIRDAWKILRPDEQLVNVIRTVNRLVDERRLYTRLQGVRLESRLVAGNRQLWAVVDDPTAANDGASVQLLP